MRKGWTLLRIGDLCTPKKNIERAVKRFAPNDIIQYIDISSIDNKSQSMTDTNEYVMSDAPSRAQQCVQYGDIIISTVRPNLKNIAFVDSHDKNLVASSGFCVLRPEKVSKNYLFHYITSDNFTNHLVSLTTGANYPAVRDNDIFDSKIPIPPKSSQLAIVAELDKINELISIKKKQLKEFNNLAQSLFYEMFGDPIANEKSWEVKSFGELCSQISNGYNAKLEEDTYKDHGIMYFRCQNVWRNRFDYTDLVYIDEETNQLMKSSSLKHNDFLITKIGRVNTENSSLGRVSLYQGEDNKANLSGNLCFARLKENIAIHKFILYILISNQFRDYIRRTTVGGIDKRALNVKQISSFPIICPPVELQKLFVNRVELIEQQKETIIKAINELTNLYSSRIQFWFDVNESADAIVNNYYAEKVIEDKYDELYPNGQGSITVNYGKDSPCVINQIDFKSLATAYNYILDNGANTFEKISKELFLTIDKPHFCVLVELGLIGTEDYKTFNIPL